MARDSGIGLQYELSYEIGLTIISFLAIALYNVVELTLVIFTTFKRRHGLYFYSLLIATWGIVPYSIGFFFKFFDVTSSNELYISLIALGWPCMITGQSLVLYSRLHLINTESTWANNGKWVLTMIVVDALICHVPIIVLLYGANSQNPGPFLIPYSVYEKIQITIFFIQEVVISSVYVCKTTKLLVSGGNIRGRNSRTVMQHLVWVNVIIIVLDITLLAIEYAGYYNIQVTYKAAVYSVKLKMEFSILNKLLDLFQGRIRDNSSDDQCSRSRTQTMMVRAVGFGTGIKKAITTKSKAAKPKEPGASGEAGDKSPMGNTAYAKVEANRSAVSGINLQDMEVIRTTEVRVESCERLPEDKDIESVDKDYVSTMTVPARPKSASSSQRHIVYNED